MSNLLENINYPGDIKGLSDAEMISLAEEIRTFLVDSVSRTGGHLASNLGVVELTLALYNVFDTPDDKIVFDVGHQCYISKILTGRKNDFFSIRCDGGISGFPKISESEFDSFGTGHSSTAISASLGIATANKLMGKSNYAIALVGDGAMSGGLAYEALNNCRPDLNLIVILNENEMSISRNVGNTAKLLSGVRSRKNYFAFKNFTRRITEWSPSLYKAVSGIKRYFKNAIFKTDIIENFGFKYYGPIDGNDYETVKRVLSEVKKHGGCAFVHVKTVKGKGYAPSEAAPEKFHAVKPIGTPSSESSFSCETGKTLLELAKDNASICAVTAAMADSTGLSEFFEEFPERAFDVGIAEAHAMTFSAGLSSSGYFPVFAVYSSFFQRSYDNLIHDMAIQNLSCALLIDRAGLSSDDGATHHGIFDVSMLSSISNSKIYSVISYESLRSALRDACGGDGIFAIRYPKGAESTGGLKRVCDYVYTDEHFDVSASVLIVTYGRIYTEAIRAKEQLLKRGILANVLVLEFLKPYEESFEKICRYTESAEKIIILEEGISSGGFGQNILALSSRAQLCKDIRVLAIEGKIPDHASLAKLYGICGISAENIVEEVLKNEN